MLYSDTLFLKVRVTVKYRKVSKIEPWPCRSYRTCSKRSLSTKGTSPHGILSSTLEYFDTDVCHNCLKYCQEIFSSRGRDWANVFLQPAHRKRSILFSCADQN